MGRERQRYWPRKVMSRQRARSHQGVTCWWGGRAAGLMMTTQGGDKVGEVEEGREEDGCDGGLVLGEEGDQGDGHVEGPLLLGED